MKILQSFIRFGLVLLCLLLLEACTATPPPAVQPTSTAVSVSLTQSVSRSSPTPGPSPVATLLDPAPRNCPASPALGSRVFSGGLPATGSGPVWESGLPANATLHLDDYGYTPWPGTKILWPIASDSPHRVVVRVTNLETGSEAWWSETGPPPFDPVRPLILNGEVNRQGGSAPVFGSLLYLPQAGCYAMTVSWSGGQWHLFFAAGR